MSLQPADLPEKGLLQAAGPPAPSARKLWPGRRKFFILGLLLAAASLAPTGRAPAAAPEMKLPVVASIVPLGDFCRKIGGPLVQGQVLIPPGASPHMFEPLPSVVARAGQARVFIYIGAGLEPWADRLLKARDNRGLTVVEAAKGIPLIQEAEEHPEKEVGGEEPEGHHHVGGNPHIWLDPVLAQEICRKIAAAFIQADPAHQAQYEANLAQYLAQLAQLNQEIAAEIQTWRVREFVSFHPAFTYFARRYNLKEVGTIEEAPGREPTPRHLQKIVQAIRHYGIRVVFAEPQLSPRVAEVIAREAGVKVLLLDPVGGRPPYGSDYLKMMRHNVTVMATAMR